MLKRSLLSTFLVIIIAGIGFALTVTIGLPDDHTVEQLLKRPSIIDQFQQRPTQHSPQEGLPLKLSQLVEQAGILARHLTPPLPLKRAATPKRDKVRPRPIARPTKASPLFKLHGTSFYKSRPDESIAFIQESGLGFRWIKQGAQLGHFKVVQIKNGTITYQDGDQLREMTVTPEPNSQALVRGYRKAPNSNKINAIANNITKNKPDRRPSLTPGVPSLAANDKIQGIAVFNKTPTTERNTSDNPGEM